MSIRLVRTGNAPLIATLCVTWMPNRTIPSLPWATLCILGQAKNDGRIAAHTVRILHRLQNPIVSRPFFSSWMNNMLHVQFLLVPRRNSLSLSPRYFPSSIKSIYAPILLWGQQFVIILCIVTRYSTTGSNCSAEAALLFIPPPPALSWDEFLRTFLGSLTIIMSLTPYAQWNYGLVAWQPRIRRRRPLPRTVRQLFNSMVAALNAELTISKSLSSFCMACPSSKQYKKQ